RHLSRRALAPTHHISARALDPHLHQHHPPDVRHFHARLKRRDQRHPQLPHRHFADLHLEVAPRRQQIFCPHRRLPSPHRRISLSKRSHELPSPPLLQPH